MTRPWHEPRPVLTADDVVAAGACAGGVRDWMREHAPLATAVPASDALALAGPDDRKYILLAARLDGDGYGGGYGDGYGDGGGYGDGYGGGYGDGYGYGCGDGYGYGGGGEEDSDG